MPPRNRNRVRTNVYLGPWERALIGYMQNATNQCMAEQLREALPLWVRQHPSYDAKRFRRWVLEVFLPNLPADADRAATRQALEDFVRGTAAPAALDSSLPDLRSAPAHFDLELHEPTRLTPARRRPIRSKPSNFDD